MGKAACYRGGKLCSFFSSSLAFSITVPFLFHFQKDVHDFIFQVFYWFFSNLSHYIFNFEGFLLILCCSFFTALHSNSLENNITVLLRCLLLPTLTVSLWGFCCCCYCGWCLLYLSLFHTQASHKWGTILEEQSHLRGKHKTMLQILFTWRGSQLEAFMQCDHLIAAFFCCCTANGRNLLIWLLVVFWKQAG